MNYSLLYSSDLCKGYFAEEGRGADSNGVHDDPVLVVSQGLPRPPHPLVDHLPNKNIEPNVYALITSLKVQISTLEFLYFYAYKQTKSKKF